MQSLTRFHWPALIAFAGLYLFVLAMPLVARADTFCVTDVDVYSTSHPGGASYLGSYTECVPFNFDKSSYTPGSAVTVSGSYPYFIRANGVQSAANSFSISTPSGLAYPSNSAGNYSYSFSAPGTRNVYSAIATVNFGGYIEASSFEYTYTPQTGNGTCAYTAYDNGCTKTHSTYSPNVMKVHFPYTVACSSNQIAQSDGTCTTPPPPTATITANGASGSITVAAGAVVHLSAAFSATAPDTLTTTKITDGGSLTYGGTNAASSQGGDWTAQTPSRTFYARAASTNYPENNLANVTVNVTEPPAPGCTPPTVSITGNNVSGNVSVPVGQVAHLEANFAAAGGDSLGVTGIADYQSNWVVGGPTPGAFKGGAGTTPRTYDWTPSTEGSYVFYARTATSRCQIDNYAQVIVTATPSQCPAGTTPQTNGGVSGCCPPNQTLQADGSCLFSPNPPSATITANGATGSASVTVGSPVNFNATFAASSGDTLTTTGIADYQNSWLSGGTGAATPRTYSWTPTLAGTYSFNAREYSSSFPSPNCFNGSCNYANVTVTALCAAGQTQASDGSCTTPLQCPAGQTRQSDGTCACPAGQFYQGGSCVTPPPCPAGQTRQSDGTCSAGTTVGSVTASLLVGTYDPNIEGYSCNASSATISRGDSALMCWSCTGTGTITPNGNGFSTGGALSGQTVVSPAQSTGYSLQCASPQGSPQAFATINVTQAPAGPASTAKLFAKPTLVKKSTSTTLSWITENTTSCTLSDDQGHANLSYALNNPSFPTGAIQVRTVFTLSCVGSDGNRPSASVTVSIAPSFIEF